MENCPSRQDLELLATHRLGPEQQRALETHLGACNSCQETWTGLQGLDLTQEFQTTEPAQETPGPLPPLPEELRNHARYRVVRVLGSGGMGTVYLAQHKLLDRPVVLKVIRGDLVDRPDVLARFQREARLAARLSHPNVVAIYEAEELGQTQLLVMEFVEGVNLSELVAGRGLLPVAESCELIRQAALGLEHVHAQKLVHRDIKPANLLVSPAGVVKILDLGLATLKSGKKENRDLTADRTFLGTVDFAAPEQWESSRDVDIRADIYSLGCTFYYLLAGQSPFPNSRYSTTIQQMWAHSQAPLPPIRDLRPDMPEALIAILGRMLAKNANERFANPSEVAEALQPFTIDCNLAEFVGTLRRTTTSRLDLSRVSSTHSQASTPTTPAVTKPSRRAIVIGAAVAACIAILGSLGLWWGVGRGQRGTDEPPLASGSPRQPQATAATGLPTGDPIRVGILHSRTGTMAISERAVVDATLFAIKEINDAGGLLGRPVVDVTEDGQSNPTIFAQKCEKLIATDNVCVIFGCWTSASRKTVLPVVEKHDHLLFYPVQYEGLEQSPNIVYTGAAPNQQIIPAIKWCVSTLKKKKFFLVGSDYVFPRAANAIIKDQASSLGGEIVGEEYLLMGSSDVGEVVKKIVATQPDAILNTINGDSNVAFFRVLRAHGFTSEKAPTISFSISEEELSSLGTKDMIGDFAAWNYFQTVDRPRNHEFVARFQDRFGTQRIVSDPMEAAYFGVHLWAQAVREAGEVTVAKVREAVRHQSFDAPEGLVRIDPATLHTSKTFRVGRITPEGRFAVVFDSGSPLAPIPYPNSRSQAEWDSFLMDLKLQWNGQWFNPTTPQP